MSASAVLSVQEWQTQCYGETTEFWSNEKACMTLRTTRFNFLLQIVNQGIAVTHFANDSEIEGS